MSKGDYVQQVAQMTSGTTEDDHRQLGDFWEGNSW